jgi:hypothetical protein
MRVYEVVERKEEKLDEVIPLLAMPLLTIGGTTLTISTFISTLFAYWTVTDLYDFAKKLYNEPENVDGLDWFLTAVNALVAKGALKHLGGKVKDFLINKVPKDVQQKIGDTVKDKVTKGMDKAGAKADTRGVSVTQKPVQPKSSSGRSPEEIADMKAKGFDPATGKKIVPTGGDAPLKTQAQAAADRFATK